MDSTQRNKYNPTAVSHPGETVVEYLEFLEWSQRDLARRTGLSPKTISEICNGKVPITPPTALTFERVLQRPAHFWLNLQRNFDEARARLQESVRVAQWDDWVRTFPLKEMKEQKFSLPSGNTDTDVILNFFGVSSPESWKQVWKASAAVYRQTRKFNTNEASIAAWVRETELIARELLVADFDEQRLRSSIEPLRRLTRTRVEEIMDPIQEICAAAGVAVVLVPGLRNTGISGCARWLSDTKALIGLTLRYKTDDQFWFTFFHECGHLLLHRNKRSFVIDNAAESLFDHIVDPDMQQYEVEANIFAANTLIPPRALEEFVRTGLFTNGAIQDFAEDMGVGPGIVVGRLQHDQILKPYQGNKLKQQMGQGFVEEGNE